MTIYEDIKRIGRYNVLFFCDNCGGGTEAWIRKGMTREEFLEGPEAKCESCGCRVLKQLSFKTKEKKK